MAYKLVLPIGLAVVLALISRLAVAEVLNKIEVVAPLSPIATKQDLNIAPLGKIDPNKPLWASYHLIAVSSDDKPAGEIVIEAMPEGVKTPIQDSIVKQYPAAGIDEVRLLASIEKGTGHSTSFYQHCDWSG